MDHVFSPLPLLILPWVRSVKVPLQLLIDHTLKERLKNITAQTHIPMSQIVTDLLEEHLHTVEERHTAFSGNCHHLNERF